ncbi:MAG: SNF2-related protein, partial [Planctomycetaceae bacterium]
MRFEEPLYKFQRDGVAWLLHHERAILGDDMGLGKTAQALAATRRLIRFGRIDWALVVVPRTLIDNWKYESKKWSPELAVATALPPSRSREQDWSRLIGRAHLIVTSYEQLREPPAALLENPPDLLVADEAHRLRRGESQAHQGLRKIKTRRFWALTGTPVERDAEDLAVLMSLLEPSRFSPDDKRLHPTALRARVRPYLLRRHKTEVLDELPDVIEENEILVLSPKQVVAYRKAIRDYARQTSSNFLS